MDSIHKDTLLIAMAIFAPGMFISWMLIRIQETLDKRDRK